jgi:hypothetical protein
MISMRSLVRCGNSANGRASCGSPEPCQRKTPRRPRFTHAPSP